MEKKEASANRQPKPWERQPGEGPQAYRAFCAYRDSGADGERRSLTKTAQNLTKPNGAKYSPGTLKQWSWKWNWQERIAAWDDEIERCTREELANGIVRMRKAHAAIARKMLKKAESALKQMDETKMSSRDIATMVDVAAKLERISRGEATERTEGTQTIAGELSLHQLDLSGISDEELAALDEITGKIIPL